MAYVAIRKRGRGRRVARAHRVPAFRRARELSGYERAVLGERFAALGYGDSGIDWGSILSQGITTAGSVAAIAVKPPTYSSVVYPSGAQSVTSYGAMPGSSSIAGASSLEGLLTSPYLLLGGMALLAVVLMKR